MAEIKMGKRYEKIVYKKINIKMQHQEILNSLVARAITK